MSQGEALPWAEARRVATELVGLLADACDRIEVAGSVRRRRAEVHDIGIVAIASRGSEAVEGLFEPTYLEVDALDARLERLLDERLVSPRDVEIRRRDGTVETGRRMGDAYKALTFCRIPVDLFITDAERWGCIFALRTGPGDWNRHLVTECRSHFRQVEDGRVLHLGRAVPTPEEADFFRALGVPWLDPWDRQADRLRFDPELLRATA